MVNIRIHILYIRDGATTPSAVELLEELERQKRAVPDALCLYLVCGCTAESNYQSVKILKASHTHTTSTRKATSQHYHTPAAQNLRCKATQQAWGWGAKSDVAQA